ncbi:hypothetical protein Vqi01_44240 [Micromonospora qiuiae]|uniref:Uncharacterized protein n=1 Tax=Micromonospora qiuiae TaxID=502268 RepID=A0ABQ4JIB4_9ACTN|nr:hypothetical protein [Micromonospora qiuiae]GIJ29262.1 hypothetical protein Vqi01_44240 [Micromonospora qiuiae]
MQPDGPYRYTHLLGGSPVGKAWAALDQQGRFVTVAVLDATVAATEGWREAFAGIVNSLSQTPEGPSFVYADFSAAEPWVAYPAEAGRAAEKLFQALGVEYTPAPDSGVPVSGSPASGVPVSGAPASGPPVSASPASGAPTPGHAQPISGTPASPSAPGAQLSSSPYLPAAYPATDTPSDDPFGSSVRRIAPSAPPRRRTRLWVGVAALALVMLAGAGAVVVWAGSDGENEPQPPLASATVLPPPAPTSPPQSPGIEPPKQGEWPGEWPRFTDLDKVSTLAGLEGLNFPVKVPLEWECTLAGRAEGFVRYNCGTPASGSQAMGGELIVRDCSQPCDERQQTIMRQAEDAWGLQWTRTGQHVAYAESSQLQIDGEQRYGLVFVAYWRGGSSGEIDHQMVFRMTAPVDGAGRLRRVANYLRDVLLF